VRAYTKHPGITTHDLRVRAGQCQVCARPRGKDGTESRCRPCADAYNASCRKGYVPVRRQKMTPAQRERHEEWGAFFHNRLYRLRRKLQTRVRRYDPHRAINPLDVVTIARHLVPYECDLEVRS
jgi:hypothetical protein